jgi:hypothetical protein
MLPRHTIISFVKSGIRIFGFAFLPVPRFGLVVAACLLVIAESFGVIEEIGV